jgi:taurine---2-oxoglutarate transaminase
MNPFFYTWTKQSSITPLAVQGGEKDEMILQGGGRIYDFISTSFQASFGHSQAPILNRISRQLGAMSICTPKATFPLKEEVSRSLIRLIDRGSGKLFYTVSGAESVENALKMARRIKGKPIVLARKRSYHGASLGAMSVSGDWRSDEHLNFTAGTVRIPEPDEDPHGEGLRTVIEQTGADKIAAIIVETISGTNGVVIPPQSWFDALRTLCDEFGLFLIFDEVLVGFYRCHTPFAFHSFDARPDMVTMSKAITGGYIPFGAVWVNEPIAEFYEQNTLTGGLTNYAHPLGLAAAAGVLEIVSDSRFLSQLKVLEANFESSIRSFARQFRATAVRVQGMLAAVEFGDRLLPPWNYWVEHGLYLFTKSNLMILAPPLTTSEARLAAAFEELEQSFARFLG